MRPRLVLAAAVLLCAVLSKDPAAAGELAVEGQVGYFRMAASQSASAVFDSTGGLAFGGAVRATVWRGAFVSVGARTFAKTGQRVFVATATSPVQKLGFPLTMRTTPVVLSTGYRFREGEAVVPYLSAGGTLTFYRERSEVAGEVIEEKRSKAGFVATGGVEIGRGRWRFGAEVGYATVPNAVAHAGVSGVYGESDIGGVHVIGKVIVSLGAF